MECQAGRGEWFCAREWARLLGDRVDRRRRRRCSLRTSPQVGDRPPAPRRNCWRAGRAAEAIAPAGRTQRPEGRRWSSSDACWPGTDARTRRSCC
ncbi:hypothetical protein ACR6C2_20590 [Streptomyces sp. INA 01156]